MPAAPKIKTQDLVNALLAWRGDVANTARALGLARNSLYERIRRLGLDLAKFRSIGVGMPNTGEARVTGMPGGVMDTGRVSGRAVSMGRVRESGHAIFSTGEAGRKVGVVQTAAPPEEDVAPIKTAPRRHQPLRMKPEQRDQLQRAAWQLQARFQLPTDESLILEQFVEEAFETWLRSKLEQPKRRAGKKEE